MVGDDASMARRNRLRHELDSRRVPMARNGEEALLLGTRFPAQIVLLDLRLPKFDGFGVLEGLQGCAATRDLSAVIPSNYGQRELVEWGRPSGVLDCPVKGPATPAHVSGGGEGWLSGE